MAAISTRMEKESRDTTVPNSKPVDRDWLVKLLRKHKHPNTPVEFQDKAMVVAPMVDASDLPFRLQCRSYGLNLAFTPMIHAKLFCTRPNYQHKFFNLQSGVPKEDRPLIAQFCGSDTEHVLQAATMIQPHVDAIDINCGCPQGIARRGNYGAFLLEKSDELISLIKHLVANLEIPVCVKVRLLPSGIQDSLDLYQKLVDAGVSMITIHGRNRHQKGRDTGRADWDTIARAVKLLGHRVPILANGSVSNHQEALECLRVTNADGVMVSEALLEYPPLLLMKQQPRVVSRLSLARQYMDLARQYPPQEGGQGSGLKCIRAHLHRFLHADLQQHTTVRDTLVHGKTMQDFEQALDELQQIYQQIDHDISKEQLSWYMRHRENYDAKPKRVTPPPESEELEDTAMYMPNLFEDNSDY